MTRHHGWVPDQHGAWAMLAVPAAVGTTLLWRDAGPRWALVPLLPAWLVGYLAFHAIGRWLKSRRRPRYRRPVVTYAATAAALGLAALVLAPRLLVWAPVFAVLLGIGLWEAHRRRDRSLLSGGVTVVAAGLLVPLVRSLAPGPWTHAVVVAWAALTIYFLGTVLVVKTMIRERGSRIYVGLSVGWHVLAVLAFATGPVADGAVAAFFSVAAARAAVLPWLARHGTTVRPARIGALELVLSGVLTAVVLR